MRKMGAHKINVKLQMLSGPANKSKMMVAGVWHKLDGTGITRAGTGQLLGCRNQAKRGRCDGELGGA
jgi:hypothetical protein